MSTPPVAVQLYSIRNAWEADPAAALARLSALGVTAVELYGLPNLDARTADVLREAGVAPISAHAHLIGADLPAVFDAAHAVGVTTVIEPAVRAPQWQTERDVLLTAERLASVGEKARDEGLTIGYHNHEWEFESQLSGRPAWELFVEAAHPDLVMELDLYWCQVGGADAPEILRRYVDRIGFIHVKDGDLSIDTENQLPAGTGLMPLADCLDAAPLAVRVVEFDDYAGDVFEGIGDSLEYLASRPTP